VLCFNYNFSPKRYCTKVRIECVYTTAKKRGPAPKKVKIGKFSIFASASEGMANPVEININGDFFSFVFYAC
jgi:hypothetical protein